MFFVALSGYFCWLTVDAITTGRFVPKSDKYPALRAEEPIFYWLGVGLVATMIFVCLYVAFIMWLDMGPDNDIDDGQNDERVA